MATINLFVSVCVCVCVSESVSVSVSLSVWECVSDPPLRLSSAQAHFVVCVGSRGVWRSRSEDAVEAHWALGWD